MIFQPRVQTVGTLNEFASNSYKYKNVERKLNKRLIKTGIKVAVTVVAGSLLLDVTLPMALVNAAAVPEAIPVNAVTDFTADTLGKVVNSALQPLVEVLKELAKPIAGVMVTWGCLRFMIGQKEAGIGNIQQAAIGYILVMLSPMILNLITGVGGALS